MKITRTCSTAIGTTASAFPRWIGSRLVDVDSHTLPPALRTGPYDTGNIPGGDCSLTRKHLFSGQILRGANRLFLQRRLTRDSQGFCGQDCGRHLARRRSRARRAPASVGGQSSRRPRRHAACPASSPWHVRSEGRPGRARRSGCVPVGPPSPQRFVCATD